MYIYMMFLKILPIRFLSCMHRFTSTQKDHTLTKTNENRNMDNAITQSVNAHRLLGKNIGYICKRSLLFRQKFVTDTSNRFIIN